MEGGFFRGESPSQQVLGPLDFIEAFTKSIAPQEQRGAAGLSSIDTAMFSIASSLGAGEQRKPYVVG